VHVHKQTCGARRLSLTHLPTHAHTHSQTRTHTQARAHTHTHTNTHTHTHTYMHTHTHSLFLSLSHTHTPTQLTKGERKRERERERERVCVCERESVCAWSSIPIGTSVFWRMKSEIPGVIFHLVHVHKQICGFQRRTRRHRPSPPRAQGVDLFLTTPVVCTRQQ